MKSTCENGWVIANYKLLASLIQQQNGRQIVDSAHMLEGNSQSIPHRLIPRICEWLSVWIASIGEIIDRFGECPSPRDGGFRAVLLEECESFEDLETVQQVIA